jgi:poly(ADP-ribose) glycohydrolase ARH3
MLMEDRFSGGLLGLLVGDALGSFFEGQSSQWIRADFPTPQSLIHRLPAGPWRYTDDTEMAIGVAESLAKDGEIRLPTLCSIFVDNYSPERGYGHGTHVVLQMLREGTESDKAATAAFSEGSFGNGAAMRVAPVGLFFHDDPDRVWEQARLSALPTHVHPLGIEGAQLLALAIALVMQTPDIDRVTLLTELRRRSRTSEFQARLDAAATIESAHDLIQLGNGIAAHESVVTAIANFALCPEPYEETIAQAILLGGDTDTIAAMTGSLAGARLGAGGIPDRMLRCVEDGVKGQSYIADLAIQLARAR